MTHLYELIQRNVTAWREEGYPTDYPALSEILEYAMLRDSSNLRFLRAAQLRALETYWYLRLVEKTPHVFDLYRRYYPNPMELLQALGLDRQEIKDFILGEIMAGRSIDTLWERIQNDGDFVKQHKLESVRETMVLDYPSYILALAMGAGKTILIGAIAASEFALALEYPDGPFVQNALVFAPGLTILESLRQLADVPWEKIIPPRLHGPFEASYKLIFTRDGEKDLPVIRGSRYNLIVTNTEKIRIQKKIRRHASWSQMQFEHIVQQYTEEANLRLQAIASLPNLGVFSDEAHHTYGQDVGKDLKRVRQTVDYLHEKTDVVCVVNTTGTPYYERQPLRDVVIWYGLSQGIRDDILKSLDGSIYAYSYPQDEADQFVAEVVRDFFQDYGNARLPNGAPARLALYFPQTDDLDELRPTVEQALIELGYPADIVLRNTSKSTQAEIDAFNRLNDPHSRHRVILLVNKGTEGWDCPSLFACGLARKLQHSHNFVLQASTRCLRQVSGNSLKARIYLSMENREVLDQQLQETYGETIQQLSQTGGEMGTARLTVRKWRMPPLVVTKLVRQVVPAGDAVERQDSDIPTLTMPDVPASTPVVRQVYTPMDGEGTVLRQVGEAEAAYAERSVDLYAAATELAAVQRLDVWAMYIELKRVYGAGGNVPEAHLSALAAQIEANAARYRIEEVEVETALALIKLDGFQTDEEDGEIVYTAEIHYQKGKEHLLTRWQEMAARNGGNFGFHYDPYYFDSKPEQSYFTQLLEAVNLRPEQVEEDRKSTV